MLVFARSIGPWCGHLLGAIPTEAWGLYAESIGRVPGSTPAPSLLSLPLNILSEAKDLSPTLASDDESCDASAALREVLRFAQDVQWRESPMGKDATPNQ